VFRVEGLGKTLPGGRVLLQNLNLAFQRGAKIGLLGLNGAGKSSLLKIIGGIDSEYDGLLWKQAGLKIGCLAQEPQLDTARSIHDNIMDGLKEKTDLLQQFEDLSQRMAEPDADLDALLEEQSAVQAQLEHLDCWNLQHQVDLAKAALRVPDDGADITKLSGGERRRVALCRLLLERPDVLLLDEPTNHLDADSVAWLESFLREYKGTVVAITHDRYFLDNVAGWILEIDRGNAYPFQGNYSSWLERKSSRLEAEKKADRKRQRAMEEELQWIRQGAKGRQSKSKARVAAYEKMVAVDAENRSKSKFLSGQIVIPPAPRLGDKVLEVQGLGKTFGGRKLFSDVSFSVPKGAVVGIIGPNGTGKSTLLKVITGETDYDEGSVTVGASVKIGMASQTRQELVDNMRVLDYVGDGSDTVAVGEGEGEAMPVRQYLASFNLVGELATKLLGSLSGGERNRVHLAKVLKGGFNFLMLDEPSNDLDVDTLRSLEEAVADFSGCAMIVSHDRYLIDRLASHLLVFHPPNADGSPGRVEWFEGNYSEYDEYAKRKAGSFRLTTGSGLSQTGKLATLGLN
jgi:ATP-binding cassette ChvD family protein